MEFVRCAGSLQLHIRFNHRHQLRHDTCMISNVENGPAQNALVVIDPLNASNNEPLYDVFTVPLW